MALVASGSLPLGSFDNATINVPAGAAPGHIAVVQVYIENNPKTITPPAGFAQKFGPDAVASSHYTYWFWKRLTEADTGAYVFTWSGSEPRQAAVSLWSGRAVDGDPFGDSDVGQSSGMGFADLSADAVGGEDAVWFGSTWSSGVLTPPTGFATAQNVNEIGLAYLEDVSAGTVAADDAAYTTSSDKVARLALLLAESAAVELAGTIRSTSSLRGALRLSVGLAGAVASESSAAGALTIRVNLAGRTVSQSRLLGDLDLPTQMELAGTMASVSGGRGDLSLRVHMAGTVRSVSSLRADLSMGPMLLAGSIASVSSLAGRLGMGMALAGSIHSVSGLSGNLLTEESSLASIPSARVISVPALSRVIVIQ